MKIGVDPDSLTKGSRVYVEATVGRRWRGRPSLKVNPDLSRAIDQRELTEARLAEIRERHEMIDDIVALRNQVAERGETIEALENQLVRLQEVLNRMGAHAAGQVVL